MINAFLLFLVSLVLMISFLMLMQTRIINLIKLLIIQNLILATYLFSKIIQYPNMEEYISLGIIIIIKVLVLPWALWKLAKFLNLTHHIEPIINKPSLQFVGIILITFTLLLSHQIEANIGQKAIAGFSLALANSLIALLVIIFKRKAISQVIGLLVIENSIFLLSVTLTRGFPWLIELGMGFDVLIGFMIFGLFLLRIRSTHGSMNLHHLEHLRERK